MAFNITGGKRISVLDPPNTPQDHGSIIYPFLEKMGKCPFQKKKSSIFPPIPN